MRARNRFYPYLIAGILLVVMIFGLVLLAYLFVIGAIAGMVLYAFSWIRERFFTPPKRKARKKSSGRIIDSNDWRKL